VAVNHPFFLPKILEMKKFILMVVVLFATSTIFAQEESGVDFYVAAGLSMTNNNDFAVSSYPSVEFGLMKDNMSLALVGGRGNLDGLGSSSDHINDYWYELKTAASFPLGSLDGYGLLGIGNYVGTKNMFIEYGVGASYMPNKFGIYAQTSNWDGIWYVTTGVMYNL